MSYTEKHIGKLIPIFFHTEEAMEDFMESKLIEDEKQSLIEHYDNVKEAFFDVFRKYFYYNKKTKTLFEIQDNEVDEGEDISEFELNKDGSISYVVEFYNGSCDLTESLDDLLYCLEFIPKPETDFIEVVKSLNNELYHKLGDEPKERHFFYTTDGYVDIIGYGEITLWNSEDDGRKWLKDINDYEPFLPFIKRIFNEKMNELGNLYL